MRDARDTAIAKYQQEQCKCQINKNNTQHDTAKPAAYQTPKDHTSIETQEHPHTHIPIPFIPIFFA